MREAIDAWRDIGVHDLRRLALNGCEDGIDRILATVPWTKAIAVGLKLRVPFGLERGGDSCLPRPIGHHGHP